MISNKNYWYTRAYNRSYNDKYIIKKIKPIVDVIKKKISINKNTSILDVGCAIGCFTYQFMKLSDKVMGIDNCDYVFKKNPCKNLKLVDATDMPFKDNSFDIVFCSCLFHHVLNHKKVINEMERVAKKYIIVHDLNPRSIFTKYHAVTIKEERKLLEKEMTMENLIKNFKTNLIFSNYIRSYVFWKTFPDFILRFIPYPKLSKKGNEFLFIFEKRGIGL